MKNPVLTKRQQQIFNFILSSIDNFGYPPSIPEIQKKFSFKSPNAAQSHLMALERKGYISRHPHKSRGIEVLVHSAPKENDKNEVIEVPIVGRVAAGSPILAQENIEGTVNVDKSIVRQPQNIFALRIKGDSMIKAGIFNGDLVLVKQQSVADKGEVIVALLEDEATVKRYYPERNYIRLQPENENLKPIMVRKESSFSIIGKVVGVIRRL